MSRPAPLAAALSALLLVACASVPAPRPVAESHTLFPGTRLSMELPPGFHHDPGLPGFASEDEHAVIFATELPGSVYSTLRSFTGEALQKTGVRLIEQEKVTVDGWPGRLYRASQPGPTTSLERWMVVFGDGSVSVLLNAVAPREQWDALSEPLRSALLSTRWHREGAPEGASEGALETGGS